MIGSIVALAIKDLRLLVRDPLALFWVLGFPLLFATLFGSIELVDLNAATVRLVIVDEAGASPIAARLRAHEGLIVTAAPSVEEAKRRVLAREASGYLRIPAGAQLMVAPGTLPTAPLELGIDPASPAAAALLEGRILDSGLGALGKLIRGRLVRLPLRAAEGPRSGYELAFPAAVLWGVIGCCASFAIGIAIERQAGTWRRLWSAPIGRAGLLAGKGLACMIACALVILLLSLAARAFAVRVEQPLTLLAVALSTAFGFTGLTMALAQLGRSPQATAGAGWATLLVLAMTGGAMVPEVAMPPWMSRIGGCSPVRWAIEGLEIACWRGGPAGWQCLGLLALGALGLAVGAALLSRER